MLQNMSRGLVQNQWGQKAGPIWNTLSFILLGLLLQDPDAITLEEVLSQQKLASDKEEFKRKELEREALEWSKDPSCGVAMDGKVCQNTRAKACSNKACYICCQKLSNKCFYHRT